MRNLTVVIALIAAIALAITIGYVAGLTHAPFSPHNTDEDGTHWLQDEPGLEGGLQVRHERIHTLDPHDEALLILAPQTPYREQEIDALGRFLHAGGRAIIADEAGTGRHLVDQLDLGVAISRAPVFSTSYIDEPFRPLVDDTGLLEGLPDNLESPRTHAVTGAGDAVLRTHELSWLDLDHDGRPSLDEPQAAFAVARLVPTDEGRLLVVGAPALFQQTPPTSEPEPGQQARKAMLAWLTEGDRQLVLHEAHRGAADPFALTPVFAETTPILQAALLFAAAAFLVLAVFGIRLHRIRPPRQKSDTRTQQDPVLRAALFELPER